MENLVLIQRSVGDRHWHQVQLQWLLYRMTRVHQTKNLERYADDSMLTISDPFGSEVLDWMASD